MAGVANGGKKPCWYGRSNGLSDMSVASSWNPGKVGTKKTKSKGHYHDLPSTHLRYAK